jgi:hypothetical protein
MTSNNQESEDDIVIVVQSRKPTEKDEFYLSWGRELVKNEFNLSNDLLKQQITLSLGILAVSFIFENLFKESHALKSFTLLSFFLSLLISFVGVMPFTRQDVWLDSPDDIETFKKDALKYKRNCYKSSAVFIIVGIGLIMINMIFLT